ncbi:ABC transporter permease [Spirillospora sp. CA-255316]
MTATMTVPPAAGADAVPADPPRPSLRRLTAVELRKMTDTRSGRWILILTALLTPALMPVIIFTVPAEEQSLREFFVSSQAAVSILLPVLGILSVTSEWSQRTALTTFALVPGRGRVVSAKLLGSAVLAAAFVAIGLVSAVAARAIGGLAGRSEGAWSLPPALVGQGLLVSAAMVVMGVAFGMLLLSPALAIVLYFLLPTVWTTLGEMIERLRGPAGWLDTSRTFSPLTEPGVTAGEWARVGVSVAVWVLLPLVIGLVRLTRREVK